MEITPSIFQQAIYDFIETGRGSGVVIAVAGSGKTTTIVNAAKLLPVGASAAFVAFNKAIATELATKLPMHVKSQTLNSMGFGAWARMCRGKLFVDGMKTRKIMDDILTDAELKQYGAALPRLVALAKSVGIVPAGAKGPWTGLTEDSDYNWKELIDFYELTIADKGTPCRLTELARTVLKESIRLADRTIDFDDQLYMPVIGRANFFQYDFLFVDEAQDVNMVQRAMLRMALKRNGRLIAVGDPCQAIYGFRGADHNAIEAIKDEFSAIELPLSISYRCPRTVVTLAQKYVSHILPHDAAPDGSVSRPKEFTVGEFKANDVIVCRTTAPVVALAYKLIRSKVACFVMGREIGQGLVAVIDKMKADSVDDLMEKLQTYRLRETLRLLAAKQDTKAEALEDRLDTIEVFIDGLTEDSRTINQLKNDISSMFSDNMQATAVKLMTQHKSKGLEADRVFILDFALNEKFMAKASNQQKQEFNLAYVAITRSKSELTFIDSKMFSQKVAK
jgi:DNA helicase II / ATP-dependent DNA helicase PcrA